MKDFFKKPVAVIVSITLALAIFLSSVTAVLILNGIIDGGFFAELLKTSGTVDNDNKNDKPIDESQPSYPDEPDYDDPDSPWVDTSSDDEDDDTASGSTSSDNTSSGSTPVEPEPPVVTPLTGEIAEVFHDQGGIYMSPIQPTSTDRVTIRLRAERNNISWANIHISTDYGKSWVEYPLKFNATEKNLIFEDWAIIIPKQAKDYYYYFTVGNDDEDSKHYYGIYGMTTSAIINISNCFFTRVNGDTPEWAYGRYWYGLNPNAFYNGDPLNDASGQLMDLSVGQQMNGDHFRQFFGGDLQGITEKLDYLQSLGIEGVYTNPIMMSYDAAGYGWQDIYSIAARNGNEEAYANLADALHSNNMRLMNDNVGALFTNHSIWFNDQGYDLWPFVGASQSKDSKFFDMLKFNLWPTDYFKRYSSWAPDYSSKYMQEIMYSKPDSFIQRYASEPFNLDATRYDSSVWLWASGMTKEQVVAEQEAAAKKANPDYFFMAENNVYENLAWDSTWPSAYSDATRNLSNLSITISQFKKNTINLMHNKFSRPAALASYVYMDMIDRNRIRTGQKNQWAINSSTIVQMTYLGSPSLRYGNETNSDYTMSHRINAFDWDEREWDFLNFYTVKALGKLRQEFTCLKDGVVKWGDLSDSTRFVTFARWDQKGTVITAVNNLPQALEHEMNVRQFGLTDGTVLTDYFTGKTYTVNEGKITANIQAGGTIFVTGGKSALNRDEFAITNLDSKDASIVTTEAGVYSITATGDLNAKNDKGLFALTPAFDTVAVSAKLTVGSGSAALTVRNGEEADDLAYSVVVEDGKLSVYARTEEGKKPTLVTTANVTDGSVIEIDRNANNLFRTRVDGTLVNDSGVAVPMNTKVYAGVAGLSGTVTAKNITVNQGIKNYSSNFDSATLPSALTLSGNGTIEDGALELTSKDGLLSKDDAAFLYAPAPTEDWTVKTTFTSALDGNGSMAGLAAIQSDENSVFGGRAVIDGQNVITIGRLVAGELAVHGKVVDTDPDAELTLQLQRTGNYMNLLYRYGNGDWQQLDARVYANLSEPKAGVYADGKDAAMSVDSFGFGNMLSGGSAWNTPMSIISVSDKLNGFTSTHFRNPSWNIQTTVDNWEYVGGGLAQKSTNTAEYMFDTRFEHNDFRAEATIQLKAGNGYAGILFRKADYATNVNDGYMVKLTDDGKLGLYKDGTKLKEITVDIPDLGLRVAVECSGSAINVYYGTEIKLAFSIIDSTYASGYFGIMTSNKSAIFGNMDIYNTDYQTWHGATSGYPANTGYLRFNSDSVAFAPTGENWAVASVKGFAYTGVDASVTISGNSANGYAGLGFGTSEGHYANQSGVVVALQGTNTVVILKDGKQVKSATFTGSSSNTLRVTVSGTRYTVYVNGTNCTNWADSDFSGGAVSLTSKGAATFTNFSATDTTNN